VLVFVIVVVIVVVLMVLVIIVEHLWYFVTLIVVVKMHYFDSWRYFVACLVVMRLAVDKRNEMGDVGLVDVVIVVVVIVVVVIVVVAMMMVVDIANYTSQYNSNLLVVVAELDKD